MFKGKKILSIITARSGSKKLKDKNILKLFGKHLIGYTIEASIKSKFVDKTIVSTDSLKYIKIAKKYGASVPFKRPKNLAQDDSHHPDVCLHAINFLEKKGLFYDYIIMLQPTSPFRSNIHIDMAIKKFYNENNNSLISLKKQEYPPWWMFKVKKTKIVPILSFKSKINVFNLERQQFESVYRPNGAIYITKKKNLKKGNLVDYRSCGYFLMEEKDSIDIDSKVDFEVAKANKR